MLRKIICLLFVVSSVAVSVFAEQKQFVEFASYRKNVDVSKVRLNDDVWRTVSPYKQPLVRQFLVAPMPADVGVKEVFVRSINDGKHIAFMLVWKDATRDDSTKIMNFSDGAAIQFPVKKEPLPGYFMGEPDKPVQIIYWRAWRSRDRKDGFQNVKTAYPNMTVDMYNFDYSVKGKGIDKTQAQKNIFIPGRAAENPLSVPHKEIIEELSAEGAGTLTSKNIENTSGEAEWKNGEWTVIFIRPLNVSDKKSAQFKAGEKMPVAFAVWEGSRMESAGRKAVSPAWAEVEIK
ncbi:MAG: ethylbenzene dehydrogenase-related protein [Syntrophales bacterium]|nr:ethylbenzene dehydrogenase-related protein [Syntrophales bacterium]